jgi:hypothetical protein
LRDALYRSRATSLVASHWTEAAFGFSPFVFHVSSLAIHIVNVWLVLLIGAWSEIGWQRAALGAAFFAVYEGHQEAVIWYAALPELLVFTFGVASFICWVAWLEGGCSRKRWLAASFAAFILALFSKESGVLVAGLLVIPAAARRENIRKVTIALLPYGAAAAGYFAWIYAASANHFHFHDGTFSLNAPFISTAAISVARLFWFCGVLGVLGIVLAGSRPGFRILGLGLAWVWIAVLPYSFLTYMNRVPSRHTYFASAGLALIVGAGFVAFVRGFRVSRLVAVGIAAAVIAGNAAYIWTWKHAQYVKRASAIVAVVKAARLTPGPVYVHCFPHPFHVAELATLLETGKPRDSVRLWREGPDSGPPPEGVLCLDPQAPGPHPQTARAAR